MLVEEKGPGGKGAPQRVYLSGHLLPEAPMGGKTLPAGRFGFLNFLVSCEELHLVILIWVEGLGWGLHYCFQEHWVL